MKVFDIVYVMTNGNFGTQVIANQMFDRGVRSDRTSASASALAVVLFVAVLPVMWINIRRMQQERAEGVTTMTAGDRRPDRPRSGAGGAIYRFLRSIPTWVLWLLVVVWMHRRRSVCSSTRSAPATSSAPAGWWTVLPATSTSFTLDNYRDGPRHDAPAAA